jgi:hypothetical protein
MRSGPVKQRPREIRQLRVEVFVEQDVETVDISGIDLLDCDVFL